MHTTVILVWGGREEYRISGAGLTPHSDENSGALLIQVRFWTGLLLLSFEPGAIFRRENHTKNCIIIVIRFRSWHQEKTWIFVFFSSTLRGKNNSLRVERHELLLWISKEQAKSKDHNSKIDGKTPRAELQELRNSYNSAMLKKNALNYQYRSS